MHPSSPAPTAARLPTLLLLGAAFGSSLALGWAGRWVTNPPPAASPSAPVVAASSIHAAETDGTRAFVAATEATDPSDYRRALRLAEAAAALDREDLVIALELERKRPDASTPERAPVTEALLARFADLDPAAATAWLVGSYRVNDLQDGWVKVTLGAWVTRDREAALAWARGLPGGGLRSTMVSDLIDRLTVLDPAAAIRQVKELRADFSKLAAIYQTLAEKDVPGTLETVLKLPPNDASVALGGVMTSWAGRDPAAATAWAAALPLGPLRTSALGAALAVWKDRDPAAVAAFLVARGGTDLAENGSNVVSAWASRDPVAACRWCDVLPPGQRRNSALSTAIDTWAQSDPPAAAAYAVSLGKVGAYDLVGTALREWAGRDRPGAFAFMESLPEGKTRDSVRETLCQSWGQQDPRACLAYLSDGADLHADSELRISVARQWANLAPEEVWQWSQGLADPQERGQIGSAAAMQMATSNPAKVAGLLAALPAAEPGDSTPESSNWSMTANALSNQWAKTDLPAARQWASALPEGSLRDSAWRGMVSSWAGYDLKGATAWTEQQTPGASRDSALSGLIEQVGSELKPAETLRLARLIGGEDQRLGDMQQLAENWLRQDRAAATAWIQQEPTFDADTRTSLLAPPDDPDE